MVQVIEPYLVEEAAMDHRDGRMLPYKGEGVMKGRGGREEEEVTSPLKKKDDSIHQGISRKILFPGKEDAGAGQSTGAKEGDKEHVLMIKNDVETHDHMEKDMHSAMHVDKKVENIETNRMEKEESGKSKGGKGGRYKKVERVQGRKSRMCLTLWGKGGCCRKRRYYH
jgi:hypothetical protein